VILDVVGAARERRADACTLRTACDLPVRDLETGSGAVWIANDDADRSQPAVKEFLAVGVG